MIYHKCKCISSLCIILLLNGCVSTKSMSLKKSVFDIDVYQSVPKAASYYFQNYEDKDEVVFRKSNVDVTKVGKYQASIAYKDKCYDIDILVKDRKGPVIFMKQPLLIVSLNDNMENIRDLIRNNMMITDNYDTISPDVNILKEMPKEEKEMVFSFQVMDASGNASKFVNLRIQFTRDGKKKIGLLRENVATILLNS